jgi:hypothetical protein
MEEIEMLKEKIELLKKKGKKPIRIILGYKRYENLGLTEYEGVPIQRNNNIFNLGIIVSGGI